MSGSDRKWRGAGVLGAALLGAPALVTAVAMAVTAAPAGGTAPIVVDSLGDGAADGSHCTDVAVGNCTLRDALAQATAGDTITFSVTGSINALVAQGQFIVDKSLTITGPGPGLLSVHGDSSHRVFYATSNAGDVEISGLTITDGDNTADLEGNGGGGVLAQNTGSMTIRDCVVTGNTTTGRGGGGAYFANGGSVVVANSTFDGNNSTDNWWAGGLYFQSSSQSISILDSTISNNNSSGAGGGIGFFGDYNTILIANTTISGNYSGLYGGGGIVSYVNHSISIVMSTITGNTTAANQSGYAGGFEFLDRGNYPDSVSAALGHRRLHAATAVSEVTGGATIIGTIITGNASGNASTADIGAHGPNKPPITMSNSMWNAASTFTDGGGNLQSATPLLGPLAANGGPTKTMALLTGSPAINAGPTTVPTFPENQWDQRGTGFARVSGGRSDMGAFEVQFPTPTTTTTTTAPETPIEPVAPTFTG